MLRGKHIYVYIIGIIIWLLALLMVSLKFQFNWSITAFFSTRVFIIRFFLVTMSS